MIAIQTESFLSPSQCSHIIDVALETGVWDVAKTRDADTGTTIKGYDRKGRVCFVAPQLILDEANDIGGHLHDLNDDKFKLDLTGKFEFQVAEYVVGDHFNWHRDDHWLTTEAPWSGRKLSFCMQLSNSLDYTGGDLEIYELPNLKRALGSAVVFPSFHPHQVTPVITGKRYSLVCWALGPKWR